MLSRYRIIRGKRPPSDPLPTGVRQDTRWRTQHCLRPAEDMVRGFLQAPDLPAWQRFEREYLALLEERFASDRRSFEVLAELAQVGHVFLGCSCPTSKNPDVWHCHTVLALQFMKRKFPDLTVVLPPGKGV